MSVVRMLDTDGEVECWLDVSGLGPGSGLVIGVGETRDAARAAAIAELEKAVETLRWDGRLQPNLSRPAPAATAETGKAMPDAELTAIEAGAGADIASKVRMLERALCAARSDRDRFQRQRDEIDEARALAEKDAAQLRAELDQARADLKASDGEVLRVSDENSFLRQQLADIDALGNEALDDAEEEHDVMVALHEALQQRVAPPPTAEFHVLADGSTEQMVDFIRRMTPPGARPSVIWHIPKGAIDAQQIREAAPDDGSRGAQSAVREEAENPDQGREGVRRGGPGDGKVQGQGGAEEITLLQAVLAQRALEELP